MDELRAELEREGRQRGGVIAGLVNWLGDAANGAQAATPLKVRPAWAGVRRTALPVLVLTL